MINLAKNMGVLEIQKRAEQIRMQWSADERLRRTGLPPDVPPRLRAFILDRRHPRWHLAKP